MHNLYTVQRNTPFVAWPRCPNAGSTCPTATALPARPSPRYRHTCPGQGDWLGHGPISIPRIIVPGFVLPSPSWPYGKASTEVITGETAALTNVGTALPRCSMSPEGLLTRAWGVCLRTDTVRNERTVGCTFADRRRPRVCTFFSHAISSRQVAMWKSVSHLPLDTASTATNCKWQTCFAFTCASTAVGSCVYGEWYERRRNPRGRTASAPHDRIDTLGVQEPVAE